MRADTCLYLSNAKPACVHHARWTTWWPGLPWCAREPSHNTNGYRAQSEAQQHWVQLLENLGPVEIIDWVPVDIAAKAVVEVPESFLFPGEDGLNIAHSKLIPDSKEKLGSITLLTHLSYSEAILYPPFCNPCQILLEPLALLSGLICSSRACGCQIQAMQHRQYS